MNYDDLQKIIIGSMRDAKTLDRMVSVDIEADLGTFDNPRQPVISISTARRVDGRIDIKKFVLEEETPEDEARIFNEFGGWKMVIGKIRPITYMKKRRGRKSIKIKKTLVVLA